MSAFMAVLQRDLRLALRRKSEVLTAVFFFVVVATLFPLAIGPEPETLRKIAPGILWVGAMLASLLSLGRLFAPDYQDGSLEQMSLSQAPLPVLVAAKVTAHWLLSGLPLTLLSPLLVSCVGAVGAALTLGVRGGEVLLSLLVLPLYIPALVFGSGAVEAQLSGLEYGAQMSILMAMLLLAGFFGPWACALALRIALE